MTNNGRRQMSKRSEDTMTDYRYNDEIGLLLAKARTAAYVEGLTQLSLLLSHLIYLDTEGRILAVRLPSADQDIELGEVKE